MKQNKRIFVLVVVVIALLAMAQVVLAANMFNFKDITNGGANRFWVTEKCDYKVAGADVRGRETYGSFDAWLVRAVKLYDGTVKSTGSINNVSDFTASSVKVQNNAITKISGEGIGGNYTFQFDNVKEAGNFADFLYAIIADSDKTTIVNGC